MTEFICKAIIDDQEYEFETQGCVLLPQAYEQFDDYLDTEWGLLLAEAESLTIEAVDPQGMES